MTMLLNPLRSTVRYRDGLPVLPGAFPTVGHLPAMVRHEGELHMHGWRTLGPMFWMHYGFGRSWELVCCGAEAIALLRAGYIDPGPVIGKVIGPNTVLQLNGAEHRRVRGAMSPPFSPRGLQHANFQENIAGWVRERVTRWLRERRVPVLHETLRLALDVILSAIGVSVEDSQEWVRRFRELGLGLVPVPINLPGFPLHRAEQAGRWLNREVLAIIRRTRERAPTSSLVSALCHARDEAGALLSEETLIANLRGLVFAGHESTGIALAWMLLHLAHRPAFWDRLVAESASGSTAFAEAIFREALRWTPTAMLVPLRLLSDVELYGRTLRTGALAGLSLQSVARDPSIYPDPERFDPERWMNRAAPLAPQELTFFGGGPHFCLGHHLAVLEATTFGTLLAQMAAAAGLRPRLVAASALHPLYLFLARPSPYAQVEFV